MGRRECCPSKKRSNRNKLHLSKISYPRPTSKDRHLDSELGKLYEAFRAKLHTKT